MLLDFSFGYRLEDIALKFSQRIAKRTRLGRDACVRNELQDDMKTVYQQVHCHTLGIYCRRMKSNIHFVFKCMVTLRSHPMHVGPQSPLCVEWHRLHNWHTKVNGTTSGLACYAVHSYSHLQPSWYRLQSTKEKSLGRQFISRAHCKVCPCVDHVASLCRRLVDICY